MGIHFTKMHGTGNDYVYINAFEEEIENAEELAVRVSDRHFGIGSDGLILVAPSETADCRMIMYNADGSEGAMCGNGIRCVAKYAYEHGIVKESSGGWHCNICKGKYGESSSEAGRDSSVGRRRGFCRIPPDSSRKRLYGDMRLHGESPLCGLYFWY